MLRDRIQAALRGESGFRVVQQGQEVPPSAARPVSDFPRGAIVLWRLENRAEALWTLLDAISRGLVPVLMSATTPRGKLASLRDRYPRFGVFEGRKLALPDAPATADDLLLGVMTSGSTGDPKFVVTTEARLDAGVRAIHAAQGLDDRHTTGALLPIGYSYALVNQVLWSIAYERRLVLTPGLLTPADTLEQLRTEGVDMLCMVATQLRTLLGLGFGAEHAVPGVETVSFAGAPFPVAELEGLRALFPNARALNNYGCTEAMPRISVTEVASADHAVTDVGHPIGDLEVRVVGDEGRIEFRGPSAASGTLDRDGRLQPHGEWIPSGDLGRLEGDRLHVLGRGDQVAKVGGERISLLEVETVLTEAGFEQALAWVEKSDDAEWISAVVHSSTEVPIRALQVGLRKSLPRIAWPKHIHHVAAWAVAPNGKTDRRHLIELTRRGEADTIWPLDAPEEA